MHRDKMFGTHKISPLSFRRDERHVGRRTFKSGIFSSLGAMRTTSILPRRSKKNQSHQEGNVLRTRSYRKLTNEGTEEITESWTEESSTLSSLSLDNSGIPYDNDDDSLSLSATSINLVGIEPRIGLPPSNGGLRGRCYAMDQSDIEALLALSLLEHDEDDYFNRIGLHVVPQQAPSVNIRCGRYWP